MSAIVFGNNYLRVENMATIGNSSYLKNTNKSAILKLIKEKGPITRSDIAGLTRLGWGTITKFTKELVKEGVIVEEHQGSGRGRPSILLNVNPVSGFLIGVDIDAAAVRVVLTDFESKALSKREVSVGPGDSKDSVIAKLLAEIKRLITESEISAGMIKGIGIGISAEVDSKKGVVVFSANLKGWQNVPIKQIIEEELGFHCFVSNSTTIVTLGERTFGAGNGVDNLVCISLGVGIGSGIVSHGRLLSTPPGRHVGDIGHIVVSKADRKCGCGRSGCLEAFAGEGALVEQAREMLDNGHSSLIRELAGGKPERITGEIILRAAHEKDAVANQILTEAGKRISVGIISLIQLYQPDVIVLSGNLMRTASGPLVDSIKEEIAKTIPESRFALCNLVVTRLGEYVGALGASQLAWQGILNNLELLKKGKAKPKAAARSVV